MLLTIGVFVKVLKTTEGERVFASVVVTVRAGRVSLNIKAGCVLVLVNVVVIGDKETVLVTVSNSVISIVVVISIVEVFKTVSVSVEFTVIPIVIVFVGVAENSVLKTVLGQTAC